MPRVRVTDMRYKMKRKTLISAAALVAVLGSSFAAYAAGNGAQERPRGEMQQNGPRAGGMPFGPEFDFAAVDADGDGKITQEEIDAFKAAKFAEVDTNGDGTVDADELYAHQEAKRVERMKARAADMVEKLDANDDGVLSADELQRKGGDKMFDRLDRDDDGALSEEEITAMKRHMMERMQDRDGRHDGPRHAGKGDDGRMMPRWDGGCEMPPKPMKGHPPAPVDAPAEPAPEAAPEAAAD